MVRNPGRDPAKLCIPSGNHLTSSAFLQVSLILSITRTHTDTQSITHTAVGECERDMGMRLTRHYWKYIANNNNTI